MRYQRRNPDAGPPGGGMPHGGCTPGKDIKQICDITKVATQILNQAAGTTFTLTMQLNRCNYFQPCSVRIWSFDTAATSTNRTVIVQSIEVNGCAQECGSAAALAVGALNVVGDGRDYQVPLEWYGVPVCWSPWARNTFAEVNTVGLENNDVAAEDVMVTQWGNACPALPPGCAMGKPMGGDAGFN